MSRQTNYNKTYRRKNPEKARLQAQKASERFNKANPRYHIDKYRNSRVIVIEHYGGNPPMCACCGESQLEFLSIDHVGGGGAEHRRLVNSKISDWIIKHNFPRGFQVLCHNCNLAIGHYGYCPHNNPAVNNPKLEDTFEYNNKIKNRDKARVKGLFNYK